jgi:isoleucyl-tRNA synthetase
MTAFSPVDDDGKFTSETLPWLTGLPVLGEGNEKVIRWLEEQGWLVKQHKYNHKVSLLLFFF